MNRLLIYLAFGLLAIILLLLGAVFLLPKTPFGQSWIDSLVRPRIESLVEKQLGSDISFNQLSGALPSELIISDLALIQNGEDWLTAEQLTLRWHPFALIGRDIEIEELTGKQMILHRLPVIPDRTRNVEQEDQDKENSSILPLPSIRLNKFAIDNFSIREPVFGQRYDVTFSGDAKLGGHHAEARVELDTLSETDQLRLEANFNGEQLFLSSSVLSAPSGFLTAALKAEDTVWLTLEGTGPLESWQGNLDAAIGDYGSLSGQLGGDLTTFKDTRFALDMAPGPLLPSEVGTYLGDALHLEGETHRADTHIILKLTEMSAHFGRVAGTLGIPVSGNTLFTANLDGDLSEAAADTLNLPMISGPVSLTGQFDRGTDENRFEGVLTTPIAELTVRKARQNTATRFTGELHLTTGQIPYQNERFADVLKRGGELSSSVSISNNMEVSLRGLSLRLGELDYRLTLSGSADYSRSEKTLQTTLAGTASREIATLLFGQHIFSEDIPFRITANGHLDDANADLTIQYPEGNVENAIFTAGVLSANLTGLPRRPSGQFALRARDESYEGRMTIDSTDDIYRIENFTFGNGHLSLFGTADYSPATGAAQAELMLDAPQPSLLLTGERFAGKASIIANFEGAERQLTSEVLLENIKYGRFDIQYAQVESEGPLNNLTTTLSARDADLPGVYLASADIGAVLQLVGSERMIRLNQLRLTVDEDTDAQSITLFSPVDIALGDETRIGETRLDWLGKGRVEMNGRFARDRWIANAKIDNVSVPGLAVPLTGNVILDTAASERAQLTMHAAASPEDTGKNYQLNAEGVWSGDTLNLTSTLTEQGASPFITAEIGLPISLTRNDGRIAITFPERELDGVITTDGLIDPIYAFVPVLPPYLTGELEGLVSLSGRTSAPTIDGTLRLSQGRFEEPVVGVTLTELEGDILIAYGSEHTSSRFDLTGAGANGRDQSVHLAGTINLASKEKQVDANLTLNNATVVDGPTLTVRTSADLTLTGTLDDLTLSGLIDVGQIDSSIPEPAGGSTDDEIPVYPEVNILRIDTPESVEPGPEPEQATTPTIALEVQVRAENEIFLRGRGLDTEWRANFDIAGTSTAPLIDGDVILRRGSLDFAGRNFAFEEGRIEFQPGNDELATVNASAVYEQEDTSAYVNVDGTVMNLSISLSAVPDMPEEDVMALILFGKQPTELSALESLQIANALRSLAGIGPSFGGDAGLRGSLGLDALSFGIDEATGEGVVAVGKYISDDIYVSARQTARGTSSEVTVTYEVTDDITVESTLQPNGAQDVSVNYKKDY